MSPSCASSSGSSSFGAGQPSHGNMPRVAPSRIVRTVDAVMVQSIERARNESRRVERNERGSETRERSVLRKAEEGRIAEKRIKREVCRGGVELRRPGDGESAKADAADARPPRRDGRLKSAAAARSKPLKVVDVAGPAAGAASPLSLARRAASTASSCRAMTPCRNHGCATRLKTAPKTTPTRISRTMARSVSAR